MSESSRWWLYIGHITLKIWKALSSLWNVAKGLMPVVWTALIFSQLDIGKLLKRTWEDLLRVSGPCTGDQGTQKASGKVAVLSKREDFAKENWDFIWTFHFSLLKLSEHSFPIQSKTYSVFCNKRPLSIWKCHKKMRKNGKTCHTKKEVLVLWQGPLPGDERAKKSTIGSLVRHDHQKKVRSTFLLASKQRAPKMNCFYHQLLGHNKKYGLPLKGTVN